MSLKNLSESCNSNQEESQQVPCYHTMQVQSKHKGSGQWMPMQHRAIQQHCLFCKKVYQPSYGQFNCVVFYPLCSQCSVSPFAPESPVQPLCLLEGWLPCEQVLYPTNIYKYEVNETRQWSQCEWTIAKLITIGIILTLIISGGAYLWSAVCDSVSVLLRSGFVQILFAH